MSRPLCDGFHTSGAEEFLIEVFGVDDGYVEEFTVSRLLADDKAEPYEIETPEESDQWQEHAQVIYSAWSERRFGDEVI